MSPTLAEVRAWDAADPFAAMRERFDLPAGVIYLDGNSLGAAPRAVHQRLRDVLATEWAEGLVRSWNRHDWIGAPARVGAKIGRLIGAQPGEVIVADSTSVDLFKLIVAGLQRQAPRQVILTEAGDFPTDGYVAQGVQSLLPGVIVRAVPPDQLAAAIDESVALLMLTEVNYRTGARHDMAALTAQAHAAGALTLWDLSHSAGAVPVDLTRAGADLAVGCGYKYLNGGPGAPAWLYVARRLQDALVSPLTGWMGHAEPFAFDGDYRPTVGIERFLCGTPPMLSLLALECGVDLMAEVDLPALAGKGQRLCSLFIDCVEAGGAGLALVTPRDPAARGSQVSFAHPEAWAIMQAMIDRGVIGDFRAPDVLRCGFTPLYLRYEDAWRAAETLLDILETGAWREPRFQARSRVT
ncbi:MAG TPA: kynureninase [Caulobacteraceae bacterium]|nr:kynureninase [Caulobacteraceae bacterium]